MSKESVIQCIGFILDGNRRWARKRGLPTFEGHRRGLKVLQDIAISVRDRGVPHMVVYAFSTENWDRAPEEVNYLLDLFRTAAKESVSLFGEGVRIRLIGESERFDADLQKTMREIEKETATNHQMTLWVCLSYGGRAEITEAARRVVAANVPITKESLRAHMWSAEMPDPDLIIRTGGRHRVSNFLLWQAAYSELFFLDTLWPDMTPKILDGVLSEYEGRVRTFGI